MLLGLLVIVSLFLVSCVQPGQGNSPTGQATAPVVATSCDGDTICEVAKTVSTRARSSNDLILTSDTKKVSVQGDLDISGKITWIELRQKLFRT